MSDESLDELKAAVEALSAKNRELLGELKVAKAKAKGSEIDPADYAALQNTVEELTSKLVRAEKDYGKNIEGLQKSLQEKDGTLQTYLIDNGLNDALIKAGIRPEMMKAAKAMLRAEAKLDNQNGQYLAKLGEKPLFDAVSEWASSDEGKHFVAAQQNTGGGAPGGNSGGSNIQPKGNLSGDKTQRVNAIAARFPELAANG